MSAIQDILSCSWLLDPACIQRDADGWNESTLVSSPLVFPRETYLAISYSLKRRGDMNALAQRLPSIMATAQEALQNGNADSLGLDEDDAPDSAPRSVRTL